MRKIKTQEGELAKNESISIHDNSMLFFHDILIPTVGEIKYLYQAQW